MTAMPVQFVVARDGARQNLAHLPAEIEARKQCKSISSQRTALKRYMHNNIHSASLTIQLDVAVMLHLVQHSHAPVQPLL